ncbi:MAG: DNA-directed DNA polymerase [Candidatus Pacearchaeota archaeon]
MELEFIPIDYDYFDWQGRNYVRIIGRDNKGKRVCLVDSYEPYFWAILKKDLSGKKIEEIKTKIEGVKINEPRKCKVERVELHEKNFLGKKVKALKIFITNYKDAHLIADHLDFDEIEACREYDINIITKYIIEKKLEPLQWYRISGEVTDFAGLNNLDIDLCLMLEKAELLKEKREFNPKILAFDIEADEFDIGKGEILMISLVSDNFKKVLTWKKAPKQEFVECFKDEAEMIESFVNYIKKIAPDILVGYFSDGFDLPYLRARAEKNKTKLSVGLDDSQPAFTRGRISSGQIFGIVHVDLLRFIETVYAQYLQSETLGLDEVASELLGEGKKEFNHKHSSKMKDEEWRDYFEYNLQDSLLTFKLTEKLWPDMLEFCKIIKEPLFKITRDSMSQLLEDYILHHLEHYNEIAEKRPLHDEISERRQRERVEGAFVLQPKAGLYENICIFDFTSMHTSIIVSFNISKASLLEKPQKQDFYESPEVDWQGSKKKFYFSKQPSFLPLMFKELIKKRKECKQEYKANPSPITKARSNAFKLLTAAVHGYIGFFGARYYSLESSASILAFVRKFNKETIDKVEKAGYQVIYGDTDSIAFCLGKKTKKDVLELLKKLNSELPGIMELELEDFYKRGLWVTKRTGEFGAKKKYALITEDGKLKIRGFETVRREWCNLARNLQNQILRKILEDGNEHTAIKIFRETVEKLKRRDVSKEEIIIRIQLKKPLAEYKAITPHVIAAKKMQEQGMPLSAGMLISYFIAETRDKKALVREKVKLPDEKGEYNISYYLEHQLIPAVENIFEVFGITRDELLGKKQKRLMEF